MKTLIILLLVNLCAVSKTSGTRQILLSQGTLGFLSAPYSGFCNDEDVTLEYRASSYDFALVLLKKLISRGNFLMSPLSIWRSLAALAEGAGPIAQQQLLKFLHLPDDPCTRQKYYNIMNQRIVQGNDVKITNKRTLVLDEGLTVNQNWLNTIYQNSMLEVTIAPIKRYPLIAADYMRQIASAPLRRLNLDGNSVILGSFEYNALWTTAFADAVVERAPFYDQLGQKIGSVDLMTVKKKVRMVYVPAMNMKLIELPVGVNSRYRLLMGLILSKDINLLPLVERMSAQLVIELIDNLRESHIPIEVAIPRITMTSDIDVKSILEDVALSQLWNDPAATRYVSEPAALPSSYAHRATMTLDKHGISPTLQTQEPSYNASTGLDPILGRDFIANKPFLFSIMDAETYTCLLSAAYTQPTYSY